MNATIWEDFELPSKGKIYDIEDFKAAGKIRSLTTAEELKRLSPSDTPYKNMCDIIDDCLKEPLKLHTTDLCLTDYQYLVHRLRLCTYGPDYKMIVKCPFCGRTSEIVAKLDDIQIKEWNPSLTDLQLISLPITNHTIELRYQTPKDLDRIAYKNREMKKTTKSHIDYTLLFTAMALIKKVDGKVYDTLELQEFVKDLPMKDITTIFQSADKMMKGMGLDTQLVVSCGLCGHEVETPFRISDEYWAPTI